MEDELLERTPTLRDDEQADGRTAGDECLLDRTTSGDELLVLAERGGRRERRAPRWRGAARRTAAKRAGSTIPVAGGSRRAARWTAASRRTIRSKPPGPPGRGPVRGPGRGPSGRWSRRWSWLGERSRSASRHGSGPRVRSGRGGPPPRSASNGARASHCRSPGGRPWRAPPGPPLLGRGPCGRGPGGRGPGGRRPPDQPAGRAGSPGRGRPPGRGGPSWRGGPP